MSITLRKKQERLNFRETKPVVWHVRQLTYPKITEDALIEYIANSASIPKSTVKACVLAIAEAIAYFTVNGHRVAFKSFGAFYLKVRVKTSQTLEDCTTDTIRNMTLGFMSNTQIRDMAKKTNIRFVEIKEETAPTP